MRGLCVAGARTQGGSGCFDLQCPLREAGASTLPSLCLSGRGCRGRHEAGVLVRGWPGALGPAGVEELACCARETLDTGHQTGQERDESV